MTNELTTQFHVVPAHATAEEIWAKFPKASESEKAECVAIIASGLKNQNAGQTSAEMQLRVYSMAMDGLPAFAIRAAAQSFVRGDVPEASKTFMPSSAEFVNEAKRQFWMHIRREREAQPEPEVTLSDSHFSKRWETEIKPRLVKKVSDDAQGG